MCTAPIASPCTAAEGLLSLTCQYELPFHYQSPSLFFIVMRGCMEKWLQSRSSYHWRFLAMTSLLPLSQTSISIFMILVGNLSSIFKLSGALDLCALKSLSHHTFMRFNLTYCSVEGFQTTSLRSKPPLTTHSCSSPPTSTIPHQMLRILLPIS